jgi:glycosyltransferase involved in cell wall biosynthesis
MSLAAEEGASVQLCVADGKGNEELGRIRIHDIGVAPFGRFGRSTFGTVRLWKVLRRQRADVIQFHDPELLPLALVMRACGRTVVYDMHENLPKDILTKDWVPGPLRRALAFAARRFQQLALRFVPTVFAEASYAPEFTAAKRSVTALNYPLAADLAAVAQVKNSSFTVGYVGAISLNRGAVTMVEAVSALRARGVDARALLVGPVRDGVKADNTFKKAVEEGWIVATGRLKPAVAWERVATCHVGMAILSPSPNFTESLPTKLFEYMALGLPVIASDFTLWRRVVERAGCGFLVAPTEVTEIVEALHWLHDNPREASQMGVCGRATVLKEYSWASEFKKLRSFYQEILEREGALA